MEERFGWIMVCWFNLRPVGATRGKQSIIEWEGWVVVCGYSML
jgi:hypothetical protein